MWFEFHKNDGRTRFVHFTNAIDMGISYNTYGEKTKMDNAKLSILSNSPYWTPLRIAPTFETKPLKEVWLKWHKSAAEYHQAQYMHWFDNKIAQMFRANGSPGGDETLSWGQQQVPLNLLKYYWNIIDGEPEVVKQHQFPSKFQVGEIVYVGDAQYIIVEICDDMLKVYCIGCNGCIHEKVSPLYTSNKNLFTKYEG